MSKLYYHRGSSNKKEIGVKDVPVTIALTAIVIGIYIFHEIRNGDDVDCNKNFSSVLYRNFVHLDVSHLMANLFGLFAIAYTEQYIKSQHFLGVLIFITLSVVFIEMMVGKVYKLKCSVGISAIILGITTWEIVSGIRPSKLLISALVISALVAGPSLREDNVSLSGHLMGVVSGIIASFVLPAIKKRNP
jgi:membrane associated rhomboid family serine protease